MKYREEDLKAVQTIGLEILKEVRRVCDENGISYFMYAGSLLGTIRHKGFIPWDDDIDIGMMRQDYNRFLEIAPSALREDYILQHYFTEKRTPCYHAKVRKKGTLFVEEACVNLKIQRGIFIDILPLDFLPEDEEERRKFFRKATRLRMLLSSKSVAAVTNHWGAQKKKAVWAKRILHTLLIPVPKRFLFRIYDSTLQKYNDQKRTFVGERGFSEVIRYQDIFPLSEAEFEGTFFCVPGNSDAVLRVVYGDYMQLPPEHLRYTHSPVELEY